MSTVDLQSALSRIGWSDAAALAFVKEGFGMIEEVSYVTREFLQLTCNKLQVGSKAVQAERRHAAIPAVRLVVIQMLQEFKLYTLHLWATEKFV